jgi:hypothetical protein
MKIPQIVGASIHRGLKKCQSLSAFCIEDRKSLKILYERYD